MTGLVFHEDGHRYTFDGKPIPGVTTALKVISADDYRCVPEEVLALKARFGTAVHRMIELDCLGMLDLGSLDDRMLAYYAAWRDFVDNSGFRIILSEGKVHSAKYGYAGQLDLFGMLNGCFAVVDAKCVVNVMPSTGPQTAAYEQALRESRPDVLPPKAPVRRFALQLRPPLASQPQDKARWTLHPFTDLAHLPVFLSALRIHNWRKTL